MPRCGCASGVTILVQGVDPVVVTGDGTPGSPSVVSLAHNGFTGCQAVASCVCENAGNGLTCPDGFSLQAQLSSDAGNVIRFGSDGGLMANEAGEPGERCSLKTVESLANLPADTLVVAARRGAGLVQPFNSPGAVDYCLEHNIDILHMKVAATADGVAFATEIDNALWNDLTNIVASQEVNTMTSDQVRRVWSYAGSITGGDTTPAITIYDDWVPAAERDGGWWGSYAEGYNVPSVGDLLARVDGKMVFLAGVNLVNNAEEARQVRAVAAAGMKYCAQDWLMIGIQDVVNAQLVTSLGFTPVMITDSHVAFGTEALPWAVADLQAAGVQWVVTHRNHADSVNTAYRDAGFHVLQQYVERHAERERVEGLGIRGYMSHDPVYTAGPGREDYRVGVDPWRAGQHGVGALSFQTSRGIIVADELDGLRFAGVMGRRARGYLVRGVDPLEPALVLPANYGEAQGRPTVLGGWACPLRNPTTYTIEWEMAAEDAPPNNNVRAKIGLLFGSPDDVDPFAWPPGNPYPEQPTHYYRVYQRFSGEIGIGLFRADGTFWYLGGDTVTQDRAQVEVDTPQLVPTVLNRYRLQVTPTTISFRRTTNAGAQFTVTANNTEFRGPYFYIEKEESFLEDDGTNVQNPFRGKFANMVVTSNPEV